MRARRVALHEGGGVEERKTGPREKEKTAMNTPKIPPPRRASTRPSKYMNGNHVLKL